MELLVYRTGYNINKINKEGKQYHQDGDLSWEDVATYWLENVLGIYV